MTVLDAIVTTLQEHFAIKECFVKVQKPHMFTIYLPALNTSSHPSSIPHMQQIWLTVSTIKTNAFFYSHDVNNIFVHNSASRHKAY